MFASPFIVAAAAVPLLPAHPARVLPNDTLLPPASPNADGADTLAPIGTTRPARPSIDFGGPGGR